MPAAVRYVLFALIAFAALAVSAITAVVMLLNPNDYKPQIEAIVSERTHLQLNLKGDLGWSFMPLGLELNAVSARLNGDPFFEVDRLVARVDLLSLLKMQPSVHTFEVLGLSLDLVSDQSGQGNWTRVMRESSTGDAKPEAEKAQSSSDKSLDFQVSQVNIADARVAYRDEASGQAVTLDELSLQSTDIALGQPFPLSLAFHVATAEPQLDVYASLDATFSADEALNTLTMTGLDSRFDLSGAPLNGKKVTATVSGDIAAELDKETIKLSSLLVSLANLSLNTDLTVSQYSTAPQLKGQLSVTEFSLREWFKQLGQTVPVTSDPGVLKRVALSTDIGGEPGRVDLNKLSVVLDDSTVSGKASYTIKSGAIVASLNLDKLNADRYLPPAPEEAQSQSSGKAPKEIASKEKAPAEESDLLPLDTLRSLALHIDFSAGELIASGIPVTKLVLKANAAEGIVKIEPLSGQLYEGSFAATASINAQSDTPRWQMQAKVHDVKTLPLLTQLAEMQQFSGLANITAALNTSGNRVSALRQNAKGQVDFAIKQGQLEGTSMAAMACEGIALTHKESIDTTSWPKVTPFEDLSGALSIKGDVLNNTALTAQMKGMALQGEGLIDAQQMTLNYKAGLRILGAIHENPSCRINERLKGVIIPVKCKGELAGEEGLPCKFDTARFRDTLAEMAKQEIKKKADAEIDRSREKLKDKAREKFKGLFQ